MRVGVSGVELVEQRQDMTTRQTLVQRILDDVSWAVFVADYQWLLVPLWFLLWGWFYSLIQRRPMFGLAVAYDVMARTGTQSEWAGGFGVVLGLLILTMVFRWQWLHLTTLMVSFLLCVFIAYMQGVSVYQTTGIIQSPGMWIHVGIGITTGFVFCRHIAEHVALFKRPFQRLRDWARGHT